MTPLEVRIRRELASLASQNLRRTVRPPSGIDLSSNDYLGLAAHPLVRRAMARAAEQEGCGSTGSRLLRGERESFSRIENRFAAFKGTERALYFSSGYLANLAVLETIPERGDVIFSDQRNHASLIDGIRLSRAERRIFAHRDVAGLKRALREERPAGQKFIVTESLFSMDGDFAPLAEYAALCAETGAALIVDEAHAVGIYGSGGSGLLEAAATGAFLSVNTAGKALGVSGAFVAGPEWAIEYLVQRARPFIFSTAPPPAVAAALEASLTLIQAEPWRRSLLLHRARHLRSLLRTLQSRDRERAVIRDESQIVPVLIGDNAKALQIAESLQREGFDVRAIRPPSVPQGTARLRISVNVGLSEATLERFAATLTNALQPSECCAACS